MRTLLVGYDLNKNGKDYEDVWAYLKDRHNNWWHHLDSTWIIRTDKTAVQVRDELKAIGLDSDDELLVAELTGVAAWVGFSDQGSKWLKDNL